MTNREDKKDFREKIEIVKELYRKEIYRKNSHGNNEKFINPMVFTFLRKVSDRLLNHSGDAIIAALKHIEDKEAFKQFFDDNPSHILSILTLDYYLSIFFFQIYYRDEDGIIKDVTPDGLESVAILANSCSELMLEYLPIKNIDKMVAGYSINLFNTMDPIKAYELSVDKDNDE